MLMRISRCTATKRKRISRRLSRYSAAALTLLLAAPAPAGPALVERTVTPSSIDAGVTRFDDPSIVVSARRVSPDAPLVIFLPGTNGKPQNTHDLLGVIAGQGYRAIGLEYDDQPAVVQVCPTVADLDCSARFRQMRIDGTGPGAPGIVNPVAESIVGRLVALLRALDRSAPAEGWGGYLDGDQPRWDRIVVSGLSQGAGMAAFIAREHKVRRVVLFSSPWDFTGSGTHGHLARWIDGPGVTPPARWWAEYHRRENTANLLKLSYPKLGIPADHVLVFDRNLPPGAGTGANPYHGNTVRNVGYLQQWRTLFGTPGDPVAP